MLGPTSLEHSGPGLSLRIINMVVQNIQKFKEQLHVCDQIQQCDKDN